MNTNQTQTRGMIRNIFLMVVVAFGFALTSCNDKDDDIMVVEPVGDIAQVLEQITDEPENFNSDMLKSKMINEKKPKFKNLIKALVKTNLISTVAKNEFTVFAPTDQAFETLFATLGINGIEDLTAEQLTPILLYHVVSGKVPSSGLSSGYVPTVNGAAVKIDVSSMVMVNESTVTIADIRAANGIIHVIDQVLLPPSMNLVETALSYDPEFSILVQAVIKAELTDVLATGGPYTVFAPTNDAFVALLGELGITGLDDLDKETLTKVLLYHVVDGRVFSSDLSSGSVPTLNGSFSIDVSTLKITDANGREAGLIPSLLDVQATNGVIHVIDKVILPTL